MNMNNTQTQENNDKLFMRFMDSSSAISLAPVPESHSFMGRPAFEASRTSYMPPTGMDQPFLPSEGYAENNNKLFMRFINNESGNNTLPVLILPTESTRSTSYELPSQSQSKFQQQFNHQSRPHPRPQHHSHLSPHP